MVGQVVGRCRPGRATAKAITIWVAAIVLLGACSTGDSTEGGDAGEATVEEAMTSESVVDTETADSSDPADEAPGPTLDGSVSPGDVTNIWSRIDDDVFTADADRSIFNDMEGDAAAGILISGTTTDHDERRYQATVWHSDGPFDSLSRVLLPTLADGVRSAVADIEFVPATSSVSTEEGIGRVAVGSVGTGSGQRAAVWVHADGQWSQLESDAFLSERRESATRLSVGGTGELIALGSTTDDAGQDQPVAWSSQDGRTWNRLSESFDELPDTTLADAAIGDVGTVVIGQFIDESLDHSQVYFSADGTTWDHAVPTSFVGGGDVLVRSVVPRPDGGFVAVGSVGDGNGVASPASWTSDDGINWTGPSTSFELNDDGRSTSNGLGAERVRVGGDGFLAIATGTFVQHIWQSGDGVNWTPVGDIWRVESEGVNLVGVASIDEVTVTAGEGRFYRAQGTTWQRVPVAQEVAPQPQSVPWSNAAASNGAGFLIVGGIEDSRGELSAQAWQSSDGLNWSVLDIQALNGAGLATGPYRDVVGTDAGYLAAVPETTAISGRLNRRGLSYLHTVGPEGLGPPSAYQSDDARVILHSVETLGDEVVMVGIEFDGESLAPLMVSGTVGDTAYDPLAPAPSVGGGPVDLARVSVDVPNEADREAWRTLCASDDAMVAFLDLDNSSTSSFRIFSRTIGSGWSAATTPDTVASADGNWVNACGHGPDGFLAVGGIRTGSDIDAMMWLSADGSAWERLDVPPALVDPAADGFLTDVIHFGDDYLMAGNVDVDGASVALVWIGSPAAGWLEVPAANNPVDFNVDALAVDEGGTLVITGWQDGQLTVSTTTVDRLLSYEP